MAAKYNDHENVKEPIFTGNFVYLIKPCYEKGVARKLSPLWLGSFNILGQLRDLNCLVEASGFATRVVHSNLLKIFEEPLGTAQLGRL